MRTNLSLLLLFTSLSLHTLAQDCPCAKTFDSLKTYIERNYAGAHDKITAQTQAAYESHTQRYRRIARNSRKDAYCLYTMRTWPQFFKDHHIALTTTDNASPEALQKAIAATEMITLNPATIDALRKNTDGRNVEGIYSNASYEVAVVKNTKDIRTYAGVIISSKAPEWSPGQVKLELIPTADKEFDAIWYYKDHHPVFGHVSFRNENGLVLEGWTKAGYNKPATTFKPLFEEERNAVVFFKRLDSSTNYLRITDFDISLYRKIDSVVNANLDALTSRPKLIIDLRGNGGGGDRSYRSLRPLVYTQPVNTIGVDLWVTPENIAANERLFAANPDIPKDYIEQYRAKVKEAKKSSGDFVNVYADRKDTLTSSYEFPSKVAVIIDGRCASTTEQFLLEARQSKKTIFFGEASQGVLDYANMREKDFTCPSFTLGYATTRSRRIDAGLGIDNKGIRPDVKLDFKKDDWFEEVKKKLND